MSTCLLQAQHQFFAYVDLCLAWVNYGGRYLAGKLKARIAQRPAFMTPPPLNHP